jgi:hypothetical protein
MIARLAASHWRYLLFALLLAPSAWYLAANADLPNFGDFHDATLYFVNAKSLAQTGEYRIASLPEHPFQTKYPPLYPWLLSWVWRFNPQFPSNLTAAAWLTWISMPLLIVWLLPKQWARWGLSPVRIMILAALFAFNPYVIWLSSVLLTELPYLTLCMAAMLLVERAREREDLPFALAAGVVAGLAYLTRTAGIALLPAATLYLWRRSKNEGFRKAAGFAMAMLPFVAAWTIWMRSHLTPTSDPALTYYTDYIGFQKMNVSLSDFPLVLWKNIDGYLWGLGSLVIPKVAASLIVKIMAQVTAVGMILGAIRMVRQGKAELFAGFALVSTIMLLIWHYPPDERFVMPLWPLAFAGLATELAHVGGMLKLARQHKDRSQRIVAAGMTGFATALAWGAVFYHLWVAFSHMPQDAQQHRIELVEQLKAYKWIEANTTPEARFLADRDPLFYLYTGRTATSRPLEPRYWYHEDHAAMVGHWATIGSFAQQRGLRYYFSLDSELSRGLDEDDSKAVEKVVHQSPDLERIFHEGPIAIYRFTGASAIAAETRTPLHPPAR